MTGSDGALAAARPRTGVAVLTQLNRPLCVPVLRAHLERPLRLPDLRERLGGATPAQLRAGVDELRGLGALERRVRSRMPYTVENELSGAGRDLLTVAEYLEAWLALAPQVPLVLGGDAAREAIGALMGGWNSTLLHALAVRPRSLTELDRTIPELSYPALQRRLAAMRTTRQVEPDPSSNRGVKRYRITSWGRAAIAPIAAASRFENQHLRELATRPSRRDVEAAFLLAVPGAKLSTPRTGSCVLAVSSSQPGGDNAAVGVEVEVASGRIASCVPNPSSHPETRALGTTEDWLGAIFDGDRERVRVTGEDPALASALIDGLRCDRARRRRQPPAPTAS